MFRIILLASAALTPATVLAGPFDQPSTLPYEAPPFDKIRDSDYGPAIEAGMTASLAEVRQIADSKAAPTFDNTIVALEKQGQMLDRAQAAFGQVAQANTNPALQETQKALGPKLAAYNDAIFLDPRLWARVKTLHDRQDKLPLTGEQAMLLDTYYKQFVRAGAQLSAADQTRLRALNKQLSSLGIAFRQKLLAATKAAALVLDRPEQLSGLGKDGVATAAQDARDRGLAGKYVLPLQNTTDQPGLQSLSDRATRAALFDASWNRAEQAGVNDTRATIGEIAKLRAERARLLGFPTYADYALTEQMAKTSRTALAFLNGLDAPTAAAQGRERAEIQAAAKADGLTDALKPWDWSYYAEKVRKAKYDLNEDDTKPYLNIWNVLENGVFYAAGKMYGLTFKRRTDIPTYHPDIRTYEVFEENGQPLGLAYFDYWKRDNKAGGAWMNSFVGQSRLMGTKPVVSNTANFTKPASGQPELVTFEDVRTMFHEFGHALHGLLSNGTYPSLAGTSVARDFVEFPSQFNEHWALEPTVLARYARHYQTGAPMPQPLVDKIDRAAKFNQGFTFGELLSAAQLDMTWHSVSADLPQQDVDAFEAKALAGTGLDVAHVPPRYRTSYFSHVWGGGYAAGYYAYIWTDMIEENVYDWFQSHGGMTRANGQRFRDLVLSKGHSQDYSVMFRTMTGHDPELAPLLRSRGLLAEPPATR
ncbi:MAG TPA: M3 family metallopeptidase [Sphingomonas sp.]|jgi:peptidyl-dipeptidase Dcp|uniref:M3 family metallopeptidase n=1 Tax=Sphingomonas sp. TaxID=28214 RepID=UPI002ED9AF70